MQEAELKKILLVRAFEEVEDEPFLSESIAAADQAAGDRDDPQAWLLRRAEALIPRMPAGIAAVASPPIPPRVLVWAFPLASAVLGVLGNSLGPSGRIHAFVNPMMALVIWSAGAYLAWLIGGSWRRPEAVAVTDGDLTGRAGSGAEPDPLAAVGRRLGFSGRLLMAAGRFLRRLLPGLNRGRSLAAQQLAPAVARYRALYAAQCQPLLLERFRTLLQLGAIGFALGTTAGMYLRGVGFGYRAFWQSTLVASDAAREQFVHAMFFPAALLLGGSFPGNAEIGALAAPEGADAAIWLHVWAISALFYVLLPRLALAVFHARRSTGASHELAIDLADPYWARLISDSRIEGLRRLEHGVLGDFALDATATTVLASLQAALVEADIRATSPSRLPLGDRLQAKKDWYPQWRALWERRFDEFEGRERPRLLALESPEFAAAAARLGSAANPYARDLILLELVGFEPYWRLSEPRARRLPMPLTGSLVGRAVRKAWLHDAARKLDRPDAWPFELESSSRAALKALSNYWMRVGAVAAGGLALGALTAGLAAPLIGSAIGGVMGLAGAVAAHTGLAAVGFGALAAGGLGLKGGTAILVGGGALLGLAGGGGAAAWSAGLNARTVLVLAVKIDVFLRRVVIGKFDKWDEYERIVAGLRGVADTLRNEIPELRLAADVATAEVRERERVVSLLDDLVARCERWEQGRPRPAPATG